MRAKFAVGIDLGGTFTKSAVIDESGKVLFHLSVPTDTQSAPETVIAAMADQIAETLAGSGLRLSDVAGLGVGAPGPLSHRDGIIYKSANLPKWRNVSLRQMLMERTGLTTVLHNDANAAAYGEYWAGAGGRSGDMVMLTLGTGVGGGVILDGKLLQGHFENAGELGHIIVVPDGLPCNCGQRGCLEQYASADGVVRRVQQAIRDSAEVTSLSSTRLEELTSKHVVQAASEGDAVAGRVWDECCRYLALACVIIQHAFNPKRVVVGGGMSQAGKALLDPVRRHHESLRWKLLDDAPEILLTALGNDAGIIGAAALAFPGCQD